MKKLLIICSLIFIIILTFYYYNISKNPVNFIRSQQPITTMIIEDLAGPSVKEITDSKEMERIIELLRVDEWEKIDHWDIDLAPSFFILINDDTLINLYPNDDYASIKYGHYVIPENNIETIKEAAGIE